MLTKIQRIEERGKPCWRLYLNEFFIPCASYDEACRLRCAALEAEADKVPEPALPVCTVEPSLAIEEGRV